MCYRHGLCTFAVKLHSTPLRYAILLNRNATTPHVPVLVIEAPYIPHDSKDACRIDRVTRVGHTAPQRMNRILITKDKYTYTKPSLPRTPQCLVSPWLVVGALLAQLKKWKPALFSFLSRSFTLHSMPSNGGASTLCLRVRLQRLLRRSFRRLGLLLHRRCTVRGGGSWRPLRLRRCHCRTRSRRRRRSFRHACCRWRCLWLTWHLWPCHLCPRRCSVDLSRRWHA